MEIYSANIDFSGEVQLTSNSTRDDILTISHNGTKIAFRRCNNVNGYSEPDNIYTMNIDGSQTNKLTVAAGSETSNFPRWSPDDSQIIYSYYDGTQWDIYIMNADGTGQQNITSTLDWNEADADWRP